MVVPDILLSILAAYVTMKFCSVETRQGALSLILKLGRLLADIKRCRDVALH